MHYYYGINPIVKDIKLFNLIKHLPLLYENVVAMHNLVSHNLRQEMGLIQANDFNLERSISEIFCDVILLFERAPSW